MRTPPRILIMTDLVDVTLLLVNALLAGGRDPAYERVETVAELSVALDRQAWDLVVCNHRPPPLSVHAALAVLKEKRMDVPLVAMSDSIDQATALCLLKQGANDCVLHSESTRLFIIVKRVLSEVEVKRAHEQALRELRIAKQRLAALPLGVLEIQEAERRRIALELHDEVGQALTSIKLHLEAIKRMPTAAPVALQLEESFPIVDHALDQVRRLSQDLRPPQLDDLGLIAALRGLLAQQAKLVGWNVHFETDLASMRCDPRLETACFRVAQEALTNIARHAQAREVWVELNQRSQALHLSICDDGIGFDVRAARQQAAQASSVGLIGMEERVEFAGGRLEWDTRPNGGSILHVVFPLVAITAADSRRRWRDRLASKLA